jgi:hypothetical protein
MCNWVDTRWCYSTHSHTNNKQNTENGSYYTIILSTLRFRCSKCLVRRGRPRRRWEDTIKMDLRIWDVEVWTGSNWIRIWTGGWHV